MKIFEQDKITSVNDSISPFDLSIPRSEDVRDAVALLSLAGAEERGAVFTKTEVVDFMLDLIGYTAEEDLSNKTILEPSFGDGDFLLPIVERLLSSFILHEKPLDQALSLLKDSLRGVELHTATYRETAIKVHKLLIKAGVDPDDADILCNAWLVQDDFLLTELEMHFDYVIGNPPYVRQEAVPDILLKEYRAAYKTIFDRADLYIPFFEKGLALLSDRGKLSYICSDRWMKNRYGGPLRKLITNGYHVESYVDMVGTDAFRSEVSAYPAITTIIKDEGNETRVAKRPNINRSELHSLALGLRGEQDDLRVEVIPKAIKSSDPWLLDCAKQLHLIRTLEEANVPLEQAGCKVGIGVASGADAVFIQDYKTLDVEDSRKLPLVMASDLVTGRIEWAGRGIVNPFSDGEGVVPLAAFPKLEKFFLTHEKRLKERHVAKKSSERWYRTIDRISEALTYQPKLLIPDIKDEPTVVFDAGGYYPHHNLYWVISQEWDLRALQTVLRSPVAKLFVWSYSVKMRGGYLRYQAQNLRRIYIPEWSNVSSEMRGRLSALAESKDQVALSEAVFELYGLDVHEQAIVSNLT